MTATTADRWLGSLLGKAGASDPITGLERTGPSLRGRVSLDALRDRFEAAKRNLEKSEAEAKRYRDVAEGYRDELEVARDDLIAALESLDLFPTEPPAKGET